MKSKVTVNSVPLPPPETVKVTRGGFYNYGGYNVVVHYRPTRSSILRNIKRETDWSKLRAYGSVDEATLQVQNLIEKYGIDLAEYRLEVRENPGRLKTDKFYRYVDLRDLTRSRPKTLEDWAKDPEVLRTREIRDSNRRVHEYEVELRVYKD